MRFFIALAVLVAASSSPSSARQHHRDSLVCNNDGRCFSAATESRATRYRKAERRHYRRYASRGTVIGGRPAGCPHAYCGCGLRKYLGIPDVRLNLARNWGRLFPHESSPRAGLAAMRPHHVFLLESHVRGTVWVVRDFNSGGGLSRIHERDVRGYVFVEPRRRTAKRHGGTIY